MENIIDLKKLYDILSTNSIVGDTNINKLFGTSKSIKNCDFSLSFLEIDILNIGNFIPKIKLDFADITLNLDVKISFNTPDPRNPSLDIISALSITIKQKIEGCKIEDETWIKAKSGWHLDKDVFKIQDAKKGEDQDLYHPLYHIHFGGDYLTDDLELHDSKIAIFEAPRLIHPPLDGVLAIDFVLRNFYSNKEQIQDIINDISYIRIINNARELYWKPYYKAIASYWANRNPDDYSKSLIDNSIYFKNQQKTK